ncbi:MAG TPA: hypothetical protein VF624_04350 [Tepidisphaeraceae bacterium]|jgi:hypothetical protein
MRYLLAIVTPPLGILLCKRPMHFVVNLVVWLISLPLVLFLGIGLIGWFVCIVHAVAVCRMSSVDKRLDRLVDAIRSSGPSPTAAPTESTPSA